MILLARIDGKSPAEYIIEPQKKELVREYASNIRPDTPSDLPTLLMIWTTRLTAE